MRILLVLIGSLVHFPVGTLIAQDPVRHVDWELSWLDEVGGNKATVVGTPRISDAAGGKAVEFDGKSAIFLDVNPLAGMKQFTAEVIFRPTAGGAKEQRFVHLQEEGSDNRLLFEIRLTDDGKWFLDT